MNEEFKLEEIRVNDNDNIMCNICGCGLFSDEQCVRATRIRDNAILYFHVHCCMYVGKYEEAFKELCD